jgi:hypothetical protein
LHEHLLPSLRAACAELDSTKFCFDHLRVSLTKFKELVAQIEQFILDNILAFPNDCRLVLLNKALASAANVFEQYS